jgi:hemoglobin
MAKLNAPRGFNFPAAFTAFLILGSHPAAGASLYERMGGQPTVDAIAADIIDDAANNPKLKRSFAKVDLARVKRLLAEQICDVSGGGCHYTGDSMHDVHAGLGITEAEFYGLVEVLRTSMRRHGVGLRERNELLQILAPMKRDVVER